jgi:hypothetical protein
MNEPLPRPEYSTRYKLVIALVLTLAAAAFAAAIIRVDADGDDEVTLSDEGSFVERLIPGDGDEIQRQQTIGIDLAAGWTGVLAIGPEGAPLVPIPDDQLDVTRELNLIEYTPDEGKAVTELLAGRNCVVATVWRIATGRDGTARERRWCFQVT